MIRIIHNFRDYQWNSSYAYNSHQQDQAISSVEAQLSIADDDVKSADSSLTTHVDALTGAVKNYFSRLNTLSSPSDSVAGNITGSSFDKSRGNSAASVGSLSNSSSSFSEASNSRDSVESILVSLNSNVGTIYSLVNRQRKSND